MKKRNATGQFIRTVEDKHCVLCSKVFYNPSKRSKYCSKECYYQMKRIRKDRVNYTPEVRKKISDSQKGINNSMFGKVQWNAGKKLPEIQGENHPNWKSGKSINNYGYIVHESVKYTNGLKKLEHRMVMESYLCRPLESHEIVHHINGDKADNRIENLMITDRANHMRMHLHK